ncbi:MAG: sugar phosphate isomerase/epimerase [Desulfarculaceae bacterium]|nr:sugar phosphate isomerase/epimerase [Desulfarculaceae bacterium]MCF8073054.1 sugar phosphate isomerase/epimerase [Desulfarculaceae bacterium]MCF8101861.1 sugar phosphate isomerase/epimerase [Desulfarculaceae bacterium]MCF8115388.1 sugar phosphate isomerase/epimerase [Desulfarculaceae bacterium]
MSPAPVIWLVGEPPARARAAEVARRLESRARPLFIGPAGEPAPALAAPKGGLSLALSACPPELRPSALLCLEPSWDPRDLEGLPCPTLAWGKAMPGCDAPAPAEPGPAAEALLEAAATGRTWPWLAQVQVNLPLTMLLGRHRVLAQALPVNPEIGIDAVALDRMGDDEVAQAADLLRARRVSVHLPFMDLAPGSPDPAIARASLGRIGQAAEWALALGAVKAVAHLGYLADTHRDLEAFCSRLAEGLAPIAARLHQGGCPLVLENTFEPVPEVLVAARQAIMAAGGPAVDFCLDVGHAHCFTPTPLAAWWEALSPHVGEMHLHDNDATFDTHQPPGCGVVDWAWLKERIAALATPPLLTLEPHAEPDLWGSLRGLERVWGEPFLA